MFRPCALLLLVRAAADVALSGPAVEAARTQCANATEPSSDEGDMYRISSSSGVPAPGEGGHKQVHDFEK